jgi:hypothetical protein
MEERVSFNELIRKQQNYKGKKCDETHDSAPYYDFGIIKCQYCGGAVSKERAVRFIEYNTEKKI